MGLYQAGFRVIQFSLWISLALGLSPDSSSTESLIPVESNCGSNTCMAVAERRAFTELIHRSGLTLPASSLLQLENPLLIWGAIGAATVAAGVAMAAILVLGAAALTVGLLWYFGVFNSHKDRRRAKDTFPPCESDNPSDANDPDCFTQRWNKMNWYFPFHANLKKGQRIIVPGESEIHELFNKIEDKSDYAQDRLVGHGGTFGRPSKSTGIYRNVWIATDGVYQLAANADTALDGMREAAEGFDKSATHDVMASKGGMMSAADNLADDGRRVLELQQLSASENTNRLTLHATKTLTNSIQHVIAGQRNLTEVMVELSKDTRHSVQKTRLDQRAIGAKLSDGEEAMNTAENRIAGNFDTARAGMDDFTIESIRQLEGRSEDAQKRISDKLESIVYEFNSGTMDVLKSNREEWRNLTKGVVVDAKSFADSVEARISDAQDKQSDLLANQSLVLSDALDQTGDELVTRFRHANATANAILKAGTMLSSDAAQETSATAMDGESVMRDMDQDMIGLQTKASDLGSSSQFVKFGGINSIISALNNAEKDSKNSIQKNEIYFASRVVDVLKSVAPSDARKLIDLISKASERTKGETEEFNTVVEGSKSVAGKLMDQLEMLVPSPNMKQKQFAYNTTTVEGFGLILALVREGERRRANIKDNQHNVVWNATANSSVMARAVWNVLLKTRTLGGSNLRLEKMLNSTEEGTIAELAGELAATDEGFAQALKSELKRIPGSLTLSFKDKEVFDRIITGLEKRKAVKSSLGDGGLDQLFGMLNQVSVLSNDTTKATKTTDEMRSSINSKIHSELEKLGISDNRTISMLNAVFSQGVDPKSKEFVNNIINEIVNARLRELNAKTVESKSTLDAITSKLSGNKGLFSGTKELLNLVGIDSDDLMVKLGGLKESTLSNETSASENLHALQQRFSEMDRSLRSHVSNISFELWDQILQLPMTLSNSLISLQSDFSLSMSDMANKIRQAKLALANAKTDEEKFAASRSLIVLLKLKALQEGARDADLFVRRELMRDQNISESLTSSVQGALASTLALVESVGRAVDLDSTDVLSTVVGIDKQARSGGSEAVSWLNGTVEDIIGRTQSQTLQQAFEFAKFTHRIGPAMNQTIIETNDTADGVVESFNKSSTMRNQVNEWLRSLGDQMGGADQLIGGRVSRAWNDSHNAVSAMSQRSSKIEEDVFTRLAVVKLTMASFLSLFHEFGRQQQRELARMTRADSEFVAGIEEGLKASLSEKEMARNLTSDRIWGFWAKLVAMNKSENDLESQIKSELRDLIPIIHNIHNTTTNLTTQFENRIDTVVDTAMVESDSTMRKISEMIDSFSDMIRR